LLAKPLQIEMLIQFIKSQVFQLNKYRQRMFETSL